MKILSLEFLRVNKSSILGPENFEKKTHLLLENKDKNKKGAKSAPFLK